MFKSFYNGLRQSIQQWQMALLMTVISLLVALPLVLPTFWLIYDTTRRTAMAERMMADQIDPLWLIDLANGQLSGFSIEGMGTLFGLSLVALGLLYLLLHTLLAGGMVSLLVANDRHFRMWDFWAGGGLYFWRFFRLMLISRLLQALVIAGTLIWLKKLGALDQAATAYSEVVRKEWATAIGLVLAFGLIGLIFDYARVRTVTNGSAGMVSETIRTIRFTLRHLPSTVGLQLLVGLVGFGLFAGLVQLRASIPQLSGGRVFAAFVIGQLAIGVRLWHRVWFTASQVELHRRITERYSAPDGSYAEEYTEPDAPGEGPETPALI
ncbi:MAG: hypothetical protein ACOYLF_03850 [Blastocatellia bacterium]